MIATFLFALSVLPHFLAAKEEHSTLNNRLVKVWDHSNTLLFSIYYVILHIETL